MDITQAPIQKLEIASRNIDRAYTVDNIAPKLIDLLNINQQILTTASGLTDQDYPVLSGLPLNINNMAQIKMTNKVPLPPEILEHFGHVQCHCIMGLFPEINRAWLTIDSDIYVWTYEENSDLSYFDGVNETILCVGLVRPKPGVFHNYIKYLLVLTTAIDIIVLGVTFTPGLTGPIEEIQLIPDPVFTVPTDGATFSTIVGTNSGRLFLGSKDGCLYEIAYQAESSWFGKRCKKINHSTSTLSYFVPSFISAALSEEDGIIEISIDNSRNILYTLTEKGSIEVFDLGEKGTSISKVTKVSQYTIVNDAVNIVKTLDSQNFKPLISISAVEFLESSNIYLVATAQSGARLYFTTHANNMPPTQRPYTLNLIHVRLPPGYSANLTVRPRAVHMSTYKDGNFLLLSTVNEKDVLWCISSDLFPFSEHLMEAYNTINLDGPALAVAEVQQENPLRNIVEEGAPLVIRQHYELPKKYIVLTSQYVYVFCKLRPVDILRQTLVDSHGQDSEAVKAFFLIQKEDQACATSLIIASTESENHPDLSDYATRAFFIYGGEPRLAIINPMNQTNMISGTFSPNIISTPAAPHRFQTISQPYSPNLTHINPEQNNPFIYSSKHNGLYLYLSRILRPIYTRRCVDKTCVQQNIFINISAITADNCRCLLYYLKALDNFLMKNTQLSCEVTQNTTQTALDTSLNITRINHTIQDVQLEERQSLNALKLFVGYCCQILGLWRILCEHQFHILLGSLPENQQTILQNTTFKDLILYGQDICTVLITTLVNSYLSDDASVDSISAKLREVCPDLYKVEDAAFSKASEMLKSSNVVLNNDEKEEMLTSALDLCKSIAPNINLPEICKQFIGLKAYQAVIELCITCAKKIDPTNVANKFYSNGSPSDDPDGQRFYVKRMNIYKEIFNMLNILYNENRNSFNAQSTSQDQAVQSESDLLIANIIIDILDYPDELLHVALYDWMISVQMTSELIKIKKPSLESYLIQTTQKNADNINIVDLLWKYYEANNNYAGAAKILDNLASKTGTTLNLEQRIEYLTRAILCMRSEKVGYAPYLGVFLKDLEDKLAVAKVQNIILDAVTSMQLPDSAQTITALNSGLYQISQLYENFAEPLQLWECQLAIIDCAGYTEESLIKKIWINILKNEIKNSIGTPNNRMTQILTKVKNIGRQCGIHSKCFPLEFLVSEIEQLAAYLNCDKSMVPKALISMNAPLDRLIFIYNDIVANAAEFQIWQKQENELHLIVSMSTLFEIFLDTHESYSSAHKRKLVAECQDAVAGLLSVLYSKQNTHELVNILRSIQSRLSRL